MVIQKSSIHQLKSLIEFKAHLSLKDIFPERGGLGRRAFKETSWEVHLATLQPTNHLPSHQQTISPQNIFNFANTHPFIEYKIFANNLSEVQTIHKYSSRTNYSEQSSIHR